MYAQEYDLQLLRRKPYNFQSLFWITSRVYALHRLKKLVERFGIN